MYSMLILASGRQEMAAKASFDMTMVEGHGRGGAEIHHPNIHGGVNILAWVVVATQASESVASPACSPIIPQPFTS